MNYYIDKKSTISAYLQLYQYLRDDIVNHAYPYGSKLPSKRTIAAETDVSVITVEHAYMLLCEEGYIETRERSGYFVIFREADAYIVSGKERVEHYTRHSENQFLYEFPFSVLTKTMRRVMNDYGENLLEKSPNQGCLELREAICYYLARNRRIHVEVNQIVIGSGAEYLYHLIVGILGRDNIFALESPSYKQIELVYQSEGVSLEFLPLGVDGIESISLSATKANVLHISPYRSFPTGITASASKRYEYIRWAAQQGRYLVEDDFESEFSVSRKMEETLFELTENDNVIYLNTFSKTISPALRVGYMVLPKHLVSVFETTLGFYSCTVPTFEQFVLAELLTNGDFERHINRVRRAARKKRDEKRL